MTRKTSRASGKSNRKARSGETIEGLRALPATAVAEYVMVPSAADSFSRRCSRSRSRRVCRAPARPCRHDGRGPSASPSTRRNSGRSARPRSRSASASANPAACKRGAHAADRTFLDRRRVRGERRWRRSRRSSAHRRRTLSSPRASRCSRRPCRWASTRFISAKAFATIRDELDDEGGCDHVERIVGERRRGGVATSNGSPGNSCARMRSARARDRCRPATSAQRASRSARRTRRCRSRRRASARPMAREPVEKLPPIARLQRPMKRS